MPRSKAYTKNEVIRILEESENRPSPVSTAPGHTLAIHVNIGNQQLSDRLVGSFGTSSASRPIIMMPGGVTADLAGHKDVWTEIAKRSGEVLTGPGGTLSNKKAKEDFGALYGDPKDNSGAFLDLQQAGELGAIALSTTAGKAELAKLDDGTAAQVSFKTPASAWSSLGTQKMRYAGHPTTGAPDSDLAHLEDISEVFVLVCKLSPDGVHIQTMYPIK